MNVGDEVGRLEQAHRDGNLRNWNRGNHARRRAESVREHRRLRMLVHQCVDCDARGWLSEAPDYKSKKCSNCHGTGKYKYTEEESKAVFRRSWRYG